MKAVDRAAGFEAIGRARLPRSNPDESWARALTTIGIGQLRADTRNYIRRVQAGETFGVLRRGRLVAELRAVHCDRDRFARTVTCSGVRTQAARFLDRVAAGEVIAIEHGGVSVAALHPCRESARGWG